MELYFDKAKAILKSLRREARGRRYRIAYYSDDNAVIEYCDTSVTYNVVGSQKVLWLPVDDDTIFDHA